MQIRIRRVHAHEHVLVFCERSSFQKGYGGGGSGDQLAVFLPFLFFDLRKTEGERIRKKKTLKRTKMSVATLSPFRAPASCGNVRKNRRPVGLHSKARVTGAHLQISRRNSTLAKSGASAISISQT